MSEGVAPEWRILRIERDLEGVERVSRDNERNIAVIQRDLEDVKEILISMRRAFYAAAFGTISAAVVFAFTVFTVLK